MLLVLPLSHDNIKGKAVASDANYVLSQYCYKKSAVM
jgi:hypothetical protein